MNNFMGIINCHYQACEELITRQFLVNISHSSVFLSHLVHRSSDTLPTGILVYVDYPQNKACLAWIQSTIAAVVSSSKVIFSFDQCLSNTKLWFMQAWGKVPRQVPSLWADLRFVDRRELQDTHTDLWFRVTLSSTLNILLQRGAHDMDPLFFPISGPLVTAKHLFLWGQNDQKYFQCVALFRKGVFWFIFIIDTHTVNYKYILL